MSHLGHLRRLARAPNWSGETQSPDVRSESDVPFIGLKAWRGPGKVRTLETFIPAERFMFWILSIRERKRWRLRRKCPRNFRLQPEALPPWTEKNSLRSRERAVK